MTTPAPQPNSFDPQSSALTSMHTPDHPGGAAGQTAVPTCRICGAQPAATVSVRAHQGLLLMMRFRKFDGPFCRPCGIAVVRALTTKTLWQGWWSPFSLVFINAFTLVWNLVASRKLAALAPPGPTAPGATRIREGKPVHQRPMAYVAIRPLIGRGGALPTSSPTRERRTMCRQCDTTVTGLLGY